MKTRVIQDRPEPAVEIGVNRTASVVARGETEIAAAREAVWELLTDVERWPTWNPDVSSVTMRGRLAAGSEFRWKSGPGTITSTLKDVEAPRRVAWTGKTLGIDAMHVYVLEARETTTLVRTEESYDGVVARLFRRRLQRTLEGALESGLRHLKAEAERRATHQAAERRS